MDSDLWTILVLGAFLALFVWLGVSLSSAPDCKPDVQTLYIDCIRHGGLRCRDVVFQEFDCNPKHTVGAP